MFSLQILGIILLTLSDRETSGLSLTIGPPFGMVKKIKSDWIAANSNEIWINLTDGVKNFPNVDKDGSSDWAGKVERRLMGKKYEVNRECQMLTGCCPNPWSGN